MVLLDKDLLTWLKEKFYTETEVDDLLLTKSNVDHTHPADKTLSTTSTNPVENNVLTNELNNKATKDHNHDSIYIKNGTGTVTSENIANGTIVNEDIDDNTISAIKLDDNVKKDTFYNTTSIGADPSNKYDLDTLVGVESQGKYWCSYSNIGNLLNYPWADESSTSQGLLLWVFNNNGQRTVQIAYRIFTSSTADHTLAYWRAYNPGTNWSKWQQIARKTDIPTKLSELTNDLSKTIINSNIADNTIELDKLNASSVIDDTAGGTEDSSKLITSGAVYSGLSGKIDTAGTSMEITNKTTLGVTDGGITATQLGSKAVTTKKIDDGAVTATQLASTVTKKSFIDSTTIGQNPNEYNLDDLKTEAYQGKYYCAGKNMTNGNVGGILPWTDDYPMDLFVYGNTNGKIVQVAYLVDKDSPKVFWRTYNNGQSQWSSWQEVASINDIPTKLSELTNDLSKTIINSNIADNTIELGKLNVSSVIDDTTGGTSGSDKLITSGAVYSHNHDGTYLKTGTGTVTSTNIANGTIVNEDISNSTIELSKLNTSSVIDSTSGGTSGSSKLITSGAVNSALTSFMRQYYDNSLRVNLYRYDDPETSELKQILEVTRGHDPHRLYAKISCDDPDFDINGKTVFIYLNGVQYERTTDSEGKTGTLTVSSKFPTGVHNVMLFARGSGTVRSTVSSKLINVS